MAIMPMIGRARLLRSGAASWTCRWTARPSSTRPISRALFQRRLVLWRLQGDARLGLVLRASAGHGHAAPGRTRDAPRPVQARPHDRRKRARATSPTCIEPAHASSWQKILKFRHQHRGAPHDHQPPPSRPARRRRIHLSWRRRADRPPRSGRPRTRPRRSTNTATARQPGGQMQELWYHEQGDRSWLVVTRRHAHA